MPAPEDRAPPTLRSIAQALGVSHVTVSLALRNNLKIPVARRQEIQAFARKVGYRPNAMAAALAHHKRTAAVSPIKAGLAWLNQWPDPRKLRALREFDCYWRGAYAAAEKFGYRLEEFLCGEKVPLARVEKILLTRSIRGIVLPPHVFPADWTGLDWERFSAMRFGRSIQSPRLHIVTSDQVANAMLAFQRMQQLGYQRIGYVTGNASERGALFNAGFFMAQKTVKPALQLPICVLQDQGIAVKARRLERWFLQTKPDAILTDLRECRELLQKIGRRAPEDVGLAALSILDGDANAGIDQHPEEIGRVAVLLVISLINDNALGVPPIFRQSLVEGSWVDGSDLPDRSCS
jgi:LacI family transcriptional regulator